MARSNIIALFGLILLFGYVSYLVLAPLATYIILGLLFAFIFYPLHRRLAKKIPSGVSASLMIFLALLLVILPSIYLGGVMISQATSAYQSVQARGVSLLDAPGLSEYVQHWLGFSVGDTIVELFAQGRVWLKESIPGIVTGTGRFIIGLVILFFVMFYGLIDGPRWFQASTEILPLETDEKTKLRESLASGTQALIFGHISTSVFIGIGIGLLFFIFGAPNPIFWAFVMIILGIIPILGAPLIYMPMAVYFLWKGYWFAGIALLVLSGALQLYVDNILRPKLVSARSTIHPVLVIVGVIGGILTMGVVGFLVGPLALSIFVTLLSFDYHGKKK